jgi:outer membrane protein TolC
MHFIGRAAAHLARLLIFSMLLTGAASITAVAQSPPGAGALARGEAAALNMAEATTDAFSASESRNISPLVALYFDPAQGVSSNEVMRRALASNGELAAARLEIERARARLRQAGLKPNPTLDFEQTTGYLTRSNLAARDSGESNWRRPSLRLSRPKFPTASGGWPVKCWLSTLKR